MKRIILWLWLLIKRQLKTPAMLLFLFGMPLACLAIEAVPSMKEQGTPKIGLVVQKEDPVARKTADRLVNGSYSVAFYEAEDEAALRSDIISGKAQHGYIFSAGLQQKLDARAFSASIILVRQNSNFLAYMTNEIVFSEMFCVYGADIALNYVGQSSLFAQMRPQALQMVEKQYEEYGNSKKTFYLDFEMLDQNGGTVQMETAPTVFPIRGVLAVLVMLAGLYGGVWWCSDRQAGMFLSMGMRYRYVSRVLYILVPTVLFALSAELTMALTHTAVFPYELAEMGAYILEILVFVLVLTLLLPDSRLLISLIPVLAAASLILCPVFINVASAIPAADHLSRLLVPYYYLR